MSATNDLPKRADLIVYPRWLAPVQPSGQVLEDHALIVDGGRILEILPADFARQGYQADETIELPEHVLMPGLVNAHTHASMSLLRGLADDLPLMDWLQNHIWPAERAHVNAEFCRDGMLLACAEMIRGGQTCFNDMYFFPDAGADVIGTVGMRATLGMIVLDFPTAWAADADEYIHRGIQLHDSLRNHPLLRTAFAPHAPYTVSDAPLRKIRNYASELSVPIHMHVHETAHEVDEAVKANGMRPWQRLRQLDLTGPDLIAVHMTQLTDQEIADVAELGVSVVHCPVSNLKLASGFCPVGKLLAAGANVALGTDGAASNNNLNLMGDMRIAALLAKGVSNNPATLPAAEALRMATMGGAIALGLDSEIGSLEAGKSADFIAINLDSPESTPAYDIISHLVYTVHPTQVTDVFVAGRPLMRKRQLLTIDLPEVTKRAHQWQARITSN